MKKIFIIIIGLMAASCGEIKPSDKIIEYYDLNGLITRQMKTVLNRKAKIDKNARISEESSTSQFEPDSLGWSNELNVFREADINQSAWVGLYESTTINDSSSNLKIMQFVPITDEELKVSYLKIYYLDEVKNIRKLEAEYNEDNALYSSGRKLKMEFEDIKGEAVLSRYTIEGTQKMIFQDSITFDIEGKVFY